MRKDPLQNQTALAGEGLCLQLTEVFRGVLGWFLSAADYMVLKGKGICAHTSSTLTSSQKIQRWLQQGRSGWRNSLLALSPPSIRPVRPVAYLQPTAWRSGTLVLKAALISGDFHQFFRYCVGCSEIRSMSRGFVCKDQSNLQASLRDKV